MDAFDLEDTKTLQAIGILADTLDRMSEMSMLETVLASKALRQVLSTRSQRVFVFASRTFATIDAETRQHIQDTALQIAQDAAESQRLDEPAPALVARQPAPSATSLLDALNNRRGSRT
ncbi:MAG: hypothetical protein P4M00_21275 [Azospirillaceae bacterium]|nr:hypothetical protein [Azospirillaceae bacterium]